MLRNGSETPRFQLRNDIGEMTTLESLRNGRPLLLLFFRGVFCPTARRNLVAYQEVYGRMNSIGCGLAAISADPIEELAEMRSSLGLEYPLLSDAGFNVSPVYGVYESDDGEGPPRHGEPALVIVDVDGNVAYSQVMTGPKGLANPAEMTLVMLYMSQNGGRY
jgi:peroxiredoxin